MLLRKLNIGVLYDSAITFLGIYLEETIIQKDTRTPMFITELSTIAKIHMCVFVHAKLLQSCPTLCDPVDCGLPAFSGREGGSPVKNTGAYWLILVAVPF